MDKTAAKTYKDPNMQKLIQDKSAWNKQVSAFINDVIHLKKMMNGWPSKYHPERSSILAPIPADPATILGSLTSKFQEIASDGSSIVQEQLNFVKTHNKRKSDRALNKLDKTHEPQAPAAPVAPAPPSLSQQLGAGAASEFYLIKEASNPLSRFFQRLLKPGIGFSEAARIRKYRLSLLSSAEQVNKELKMVQKSIVGSGPDSIFEASQFLSRVEDNMTFIVTGLKSFEALYPQGAEDAGGEIVTSPTANVEEPGQAPAPPAAPSPATEPKILAAEKLCQDVMANHTHVPKTPGMTGLLNLVKKFQKAKPEHKAGLIAELAGTYNQMLSQIAVNNGIPRQNSLGETAHVIATQPAVNKADDQLQAVAQNLLGKWKHQLSPFDKTSAFRLDIYRLAAMCRTVINSFMDHLKDDLVVAELSKYADEISTHIDKMRTLMFGLNATNRGVGYQPKFLNLLERGRLSDYDIKLDKKQKEKLKKNLEQKQVSEISKMYSRK